MHTERREFEAAPRAVGELLEFVDGMTAGLPTSTAHKLRLACEEVAVNVATYAYPDGDGRVAITWEDDADGKRVRVRFEDSGVPFNPLENPAPDLAAPLQERAIGGLGIMMVRRLMDDVQYVYLEGKNVLTLTAGTDP